MSLIFFEIANYHYAIDVRNILSIFHMPDNLLEISASHHSIMGGVHFNDQVLPLLNLNYFLGIQESKKSEKVLVLKFNEEILAVAVDSLIDVTNIEEKDITVFDKSQTSYFSLISGVHNKSSTQILDMEALFSNKDILKTKIDEISKEVKKGRSKKILKFCLSRNNIFVNVDNVFKIIKQPKKILSSGRNAYVDGKFEYNQEYIPILSKKLVLPQDVDETPLYQRCEFVLILHSNKEKISIPIESFEEFVDYDGPDDFTKLNNMNNDLYHTVNHNKEIYTFLDVVKIFSHDEIRFSLEKLRIEHGKSNLEDLKEKENKLGESLLLFNFKLNFGIDLKLVEEIIDFPDDIIIPPTLDSKFCGLYNLRGKMVHILDTSKYYNLGEVDGEEKSRKVIIVLKNDVYVGVLIDQLIGISNTRDVSVMKIPSVLLGQLPKPLSGEVSNMFEIENKKVVHVIDNDSFLNNMS